MENESKRSERPHAMNWTGLTAVAALIGGAVHFGAGFQWSGEMSARMQRNERDIKQISTQIAELRSQISANAQNYAIINERLTSMSGSLENTDRNVTEILRFLRNRGARDIGDVQ